MLEGGVSAEEAETRPITSASSINEIVEFKQKLPEILLRRKLLETHLGVRVAGRCDVAGLGGDGGEQQRRLPRALGGGAPRAERGGGAAGAGGAGRRGRGRAWRLRRRRAS